MLLRQQQTWQVIIALWFSSCIFFLEEFHLNHLDIELTVFNSSETQAIFMLLWNYSNFSWLISSLVGIIPISVLDRRCSLWAAAAWCSIVVFFGVIICWFNWGYDCYVWSGFDWMFYEKIVGYKEILRNYDMHDRGSVSVFLFVHYCLTSSMHDTP